MDLQDPRAYQRADESPDTLFYRHPRLVLHVDEETSAALAGWLSQELPAGGDLLDLMSAWASHLPAQARLRSVTGLGLNTVELRENPALDAGVLADINARPCLPFRDAAFDACLLSFSVQYLVRPVEVFGEVARVLRPGAALHVAFSHRLFPTKAIAAWRAGTSADHAKLVARCITATRRFEPPRYACPLQAGRYDPLYIVSAARA